MGNYYADEFGWRIEGKEWKGTRQDLKKSIEWNSSQFHALTILAEKTDKYEDSVKFLKRSLMKNPANSRAMSSLLYFYIKEGEDRESIEKVIKLSEFLSPTSLYLHRQIAFYRELNGESELALRQWDILLSSGNADYSTYFPALKDMTDFTKLKSFALAPAIWWGDFFIYMTKQKGVDKDQVKALYQYRLDSSKEVTDKERNAYSKYLSGIGDIGAAKLISNGVNEKNNKQLLLHNGGFEGTSKGGLFSWEYRKSKWVEISLDKVKGVVGSRALHLSFKRKKRVKFSHVQQMLALDAGKYQISFFSMSDDLKNRKGLKWIVLCVDSNKLIGESESLLGRYDWRVKKFVFSVPAEGCKRQMLSLRSSSGYAHDQIYIGNIWFDEFLIKKTEN